MIDPRRLAGRMLRAYLEPGRFYRIPFGASNGKWVEFDSSVNVDIILGLHEPNTFEVFRQLVYPGMTVADIGAHRGYFSVFLNDLVGDEGLVYAFEPVPETFSVLQRALTRNGSERVIATQAAVTNENGIVRMFLGQTHYMSSLDARWAGEGQGTVDVPGIRLDSFCDAAGRWPDLVKMDIEGGGVWALPGMSRLIQQRRPFLLLESHTPDEDRAIGRTFLLGDYVAFRVGSGVPVINFDADYTDVHGIWGTVLGIPKERVTGISSFKPARFQGHRLGQRREPLFWEYRVGSM